MEQDDNSSKVCSFSALIFIETMTSDGKLCGLFYNPLLSCVIALHTLVIIYFPFSLKLSFSPVLLLTTVLLLYLLRLGAVQRRQTPNPEIVEAKESDERVGDQIGEACNTGSLTRLEKFQSFETGTVLDPIPNLNFEESFVKWDLRAPLEVIYEEHEEEEDRDDPNEKRNGLDLERHPSLSMYYPETDSDSSSDDGFPISGEWGSLESVCFEWEDEVKDGPLIEIALETNGKKDQDPGLGPGFHVDEDNLIEIDLSPPQCD
ncbi:hypothetical protein K2173_004173 [Erythroxylum novogranatense]|uniref:Transmembrane protein n=1 Tax=Erythroxylum novogranatense TaxID=1862640 RepID=A0AAV8SYE4_9ROSI|nr:hypothetical protein K2173_004173 [Erythroxylum novogranatense]